MLLTSGEDDPRVQSWRAKKMATRLRAGHGPHASLDQRIEETADMYAFVFDRLVLGYPAAG
ncbi:MAG: hypothetical protein ACRDPH_11230 [Marmoricola sp.]